MRVSTAVPRVRVLIVDDSEPVVAVLALLLAALTSYNLQDLWDIAERIDSGADGATGVQA